MSTVALDRLPQLIGKVRQVPSQFRRFTVTADEAAKRHRIDAGLLSVLLAEGLPFAGSTTQRLFDDYDLGNLALHLGLMSVRRMAIRSWASSLRRNSTGHGHTMRLEYQARCPAPGHQGTCAFALLMPGGGRIACEGPPEGAQSLRELEVTITSRWPRASPQLAGLLAELDGIDFFLLPEAIRWDADFMRQARITDCGAAADWLVREGLRRGLLARFSFGLLMAKPYSTPHCWPEFYLDDRWVPFDPLVIGAMHAWTTLDASEWPRHRSTGAIALRLGPTFTKIAAHGGIWSTVSLPTEYLP